MTKFQPYQGEYDSDAVRALVSKILDSRTMNLLPNEDRQQMNKFYQNQEMLSRLLARLPERSQQVIELKFGLDGSDPMSDADLADLLGLAPTTISSRVSESIQGLRQTIKLFRLHLDNGDDTGLISLIDLRLSDRVIRRLAYAHIRSTKILLNRTEDDLLSIINFGQKGLDEVVAKLAEHNLQLKDPPVKAEG